MLSLREGVFIDRVKLAAYHIKIGDRMSYSYLSQEVHLQVAEIFPLEPGDLGNLVRFMVLVDNKPTGLVLNGLTLNASVEPTI